MRARFVQAVIGTAFLGALVLAPAAQASEPPPQNGPTIGGGPYIGDGKPLATPPAGTAKAATR
ncbi:hypothetical protein [Amycolatopsis australiensis]|uniref:Uncharacterized protein n=1 Tax=Amycolatopsis australiensis TaxID=546364 RepID=A0A1K1T6C9_9PSEU|nr:hypothetical protein [Amycolatopsis australiensis]SFW92177.1 hypothetical protein SAMN04489730_8442 [Amycolatopsis australiensis]